MIGIGILTTPNRDILKSTYPEWKKYLPDGAKLIIENDVNFDGVAKSSNRLLARLDECDFIFLVNDDCKPLVKGWELPYINSGENHMMYNFKLPGKAHTDMQPLESDGLIVSWSHTRGAMIFITKKVLETVGGFDEEYDRFGFEHPDYTNRIHNAGLTTYRSMDVINSKELLYCYDQDAKIESSVSNPVRKKYMMKNSVYYQQQRGSKDYKAYK